MKKNIKSILIVLLLYFYTLVLLPIISKQLYHFIMDIRYFATLRTIFFIITYLLIGFAIILISQDQKQANKIILEIIIIDIPSIWLVTLPIQIRIFGVYYGMSWIHNNTDFLSKIGTLLLSAEIYRYYIYKRKVSFHKKVPDLAPFYTIFTI